MRTTVTLDPDVAIQLEQVQRSDRKTFKEVINDTLRAGLAQRRRDDGARHGPYTRPRSFGALLVPSIDDVSAILSEDDDSL